MKDTALLIIDIQNDYFPGGKMELENARDAAEKAGLILTRFREKKQPVIHVQHESVGSGATFFLPGTAGQKINDLVMPDNQETIIVKNAPNAFVLTDLQETLKAHQIKKLVITGMMTFMCIDATCRAAKDLGFHCTLIHDATAARALDFNGRRVSADQVTIAFLSALSMICDRVITCREYLNPDT